MFTKVKTNGKLNVWETIKFNRETLENIAYLTPAVLLVVYLIGRTIATFYFGV
jgi:hypothetical protein